MQYTVVSANEWLYPDVCEYRTGDCRAALSAPRKSYACCQILLRGLPEGASIQAEVRGLAGLVPEWYELLAIPVERTPGFDRPEDDDSHPLSEQAAKAKREPHIPAGSPHPTRLAPFTVYDCCKPLGERLQVCGGAAALYLAVPVPEDAEPGDYTGELLLRAADQELAIPASLRIHRAVVPEETLKITNWFSIANMASRHGLEPDSQAHWDMIEKYGRMMRRCRQNMFSVGGPEPILQEDGSYRFDTRRMERFCRLFLDKLGFTYAEGPSVAGRNGYVNKVFLCGPKADIPALSHAGYIYLRDYLKALRSMLEKNGWMERFYMHVVDEPHDGCAEGYRALAALVRKFFPKTPIMEAVAYTNLEGAVDVWVPLNAAYQANRAFYDEMKADGENEVWHYVCCGPRGNGFVNRFMDYPLLSSRYLFWGNFAYDLKGYLHWGLNQYELAQDPFVCSAPPHIAGFAPDTILPPGDTHMVYPGSDGPWMSMRLEAQRAGAEDYELFRKLAQADAAKAHALCAKGFTAFDRVQYDPAAFDAIREELLEAVSRLA